MRDIGVNSWFYGEDGQGRRGERRGGVGWGVICKSTEGPESMVPGNSEPMGAQIWISMCRPPLRETKALCRNG